jgi:hypothetical protein
MRSETKMGNECKIRTGTTRKSVTSAMAAKDVRVPVCTVKKMILSVTESVCVWNPVLFAHCRTQHQHPNPHSLKRARETHEEVDEEGGDEEVRERGGGEPDGDGARHLVKATEMQVGGNTDSRYHTADCTSRSAPK